MACNRHTSTKVDDKMQHINRFVFQVFGIVCVCVCVLLRYIHDTTVAATTARRTIASTPLSPIFFCFFLATMQSGGLMQHLRTALGDQELQRD